VITTQDEKVFGVLDLVRQKEANGFQRLLAAIYVVAQEEIIRFGREASVFEQAEQIVVLSMDVPTYLDPDVSAEPQRTGATNLDGRLKLQQDGLTDKYFSRLGAQPTNLLLEQLDLLAGTTSADFQQSFYDGLEVHIVVGHAGWLAGGGGEGKARVER
jgi:hypothetical protein